MPKNPNSYNDKYGEQRLKLGVIVRDILLPTDIPFIVENGTLLSYYRHPDKLLNADDDFDYAVFLDDASELDTLHEFITKNLPTPYEVRQIDTYSQKLEIYDPTYGQYRLQGKQYEKHKANFYHVTVDLQLYTREGAAYRRQYPYNPWVIDANLIFPTQTGELCGHEFPVPKKTEKFLEFVYGYLGENAIYNPKTKKYELR